MYADGQCLLHSHTAYSRVQFPLGGLPQHRKLNCLMKLKSLRVHLVSTREELLRNYLAENCCILLLRPCSYSFADGNLAINESISRILPSLFWSLHNSCAYKKRRLSFCLVCLSRVVSVVACSFHVFIQMAALYCKMCNLKKKGATKITVLWRNKGR